MATALDSPGGPAGGSGGKRRRRRLRREASEVSAPTIDSNGAEANGAGPNGSDSGTAAMVAEPEFVDVSPALAVVDALEAPAEIAAGELKVVPAILLPPAEAPEDEFTDLIGQAVGLRLDSVSREFGGDDEMHVTALKDVSLEIGPCEFVSVVGPSGCGKTTLLSLMGGLDRPTEGHVYAAGLPLGELPEADLADYRLQRVSTIFQTFNLVPSMSAEDNVALPLTLAGIDLEDRRRRARHLLKLVGLEDRARTRASRLSGGEQQKVAVARALANRPGLILADEPTGSLDSAAGSVILDLLEDLNRRGATVVLVTHDPEVARHGHRVVRMIDGRAVELDKGSPTMRSQDPVAPPTRLNWRDTFKLGLGSVGRRPLRTSLTTTGVAIGIAAMSLIVALAGGLQSALSAPALARSQLHQVVVYPSGSVLNGAFDSGTIGTLAGQPHVRATWGQIAMSGTFTSTQAQAAQTAKPAAPLAGALVSLPPLGQASSGLTVMTGRMPASDGAHEVLLTEGEAKALGFTDAAGAIGATVDFSATSGNLALPGATNNAVSHPVVLHLVLVGVVSSHFMPAGAPGGLVPYALARSYWTQLAQPNGWKSGEYSYITLLADSGTEVAGLRKRVEALGFQAETYGDQFRGFEDLLGRLRLALLGLAVVALLLACLGIANTMYTAVLERTKEIGVLKALGARSHDVLLLFVTEAALIGVAGGFVGVVVAVLLSRLGNAAVNRLTQGIVGGGLDVFQPDLIVAIAALAVAVVLSTVSGLLPALRAGRQDPLQALRYE